MGNLLRIALASVVLALALPGGAQGRSLNAGIAAYNHENYVAASAILHPLADQGDARAQSYLGFMYSTGRGVPQNFVAAAYWYHRAAEQGDATAQYMLGLMYDKGQGVAQDYIEAHKWLNLASAHAAPRNRDASARIRDAVATKMTRGQLGVARLRAAEWAPIYEHAPAGVPH